MMKTKLVMMAALGVVLMSCEKPLMAEDENGEAIEEGAKAPSKLFRFTVKGDFGNPVFTEGATRGYLSADNQEMTDLWVFDFVGDDCVQMVHQESNDDDWGEPSMQLTHGTHHVCFVASRGDDPTVDDDANTITWSGPRDTFWKDYEVTVVSTSNGNRAVTLDRVATRLRINITDEIPDGVASLVIKPTTWYYGLNYRTGSPVGAMTNHERTISVPASYIGSVGVLSASIFGLSSTTEWTTDVSLKVKDGNGVVMAEAEIDAAPLKANRTTEYSGELFTSDSNESMDVSLNSTWATAYTGTW
jgi:hypothetical protein